MAETWDDLEALRTSREDLFALALKLRGAGLKAAPAQLVEAHDLLLGLRLAGALSADPLQWAGYLAPIFCRSAAEQNTFHRLFPDWAKSQGGYLESSPPTSAKTDKLGRTWVGAGSKPAHTWRSITALDGIRRRKLMLGLPVLLVLWLVAILMFGTKDGTINIVPVPKANIPSQTMPKSSTLPRTHRTPQQTTQ